MHTELTPEQIKAAVERVETGELTDAIRSAGRAVYIQTNGATAAEYDAADPHEVWSDILTGTAAVAAARAAIEAEVREQVAVNCEARAAKHRARYEHMLAHGLPATDLTAVNAAVLAEGYTNAAWIARGGEPGIPAGGGDRG